MKMIWRLWNGTRGSAGRRRLRSALLVMMILLSATPLFPEMPEQEEIASWLGSKPTYSREEVAEIVGAIMGIALQEIERTGLESAREVAALDAGETAFYKDLAERRGERIYELEKKIVKLEKKCRWIGIAGAGSTLVMGGLWTADSLGAFE